MNIEMTYNRRILIGFAVSGWIFTFVLSLYLFHLMKDDNIQSFGKGLNIFAADLGDEINKKIGAKTICFVDFTDFQGKQTDVGNYVTQSFLPFLLKNKNIKFVDRRYIRSTIYENKLLAGGLIEPSVKSVKVGKISGAEYLLIGKTEFAGKYVSISAQLLNIETNIVDISKSINVLSDAIIYKLSGQEEKNENREILFISNI
jgi:TolB-like protein